MHGQPSLVSVHLILHFFQASENPHSPRPQPLLILQLGVFQVHNPGFHLPLPLIDGIFGGRGGRGGDVEGWEGGG